jgi:hypothetical protein
MFVDTRDDGHEHIPAFYAAVVADLRSGRVAEVAGTASRDGNQQYNEGLADDRCDAVRSYLTTFRGVTLLMLRKNSPIVQPKTNNQAAPLWRGVRIVTHLKGVKTAPGEEDSPNV